MDKQAILIQEEPRGPSQLIEIPVSQNGVTRVNIPDIQQLRSQVGQVIVIKGMRLITADVLTHGPLTGFVTAPVAELQKITLTLYCEGWEKAQLLPLLTLNDMTLPGGAIPHRYQPTRFDDWKNVDWSKSYLQYANGTGGAANQPYAVLIDVLYLKFNSKGQEIVN